MFVFRCVGTGFWGSLPKVPALTTRVPRLRPRAYRSYGSSEQGFLQPSLGFPALTLEVSCLRGPNRGTKAQFANASKQ